MFQSKEALRQEKTQGPGKVLFSVVFFRRKRFLLSLNIYRIAQTQFSMGRSDLPSQYAEEVETFRQILELPDPRETLPRSSTTVLGLDYEKGQQELRPRGPSAMLPLRNLNRISWALIYLRVNISNPLLHQPNFTRLDNLVLKTKFRGSIQISPRSVFLLSPLGPLWARFLYKFSRNLNTKLGRISLPSILQLLLLPLADCLFL